MVKNFKNLFLRNQEADDWETWYTGSGARVLPIFHMMTLGWPRLFLWQGQICFRMLIQHWVLMYFQVCYNSTYPQHPDERYRTSGPLVYLYHGSDKVCKIRFVSTGTNRGKPCLVCKYYYSIACKLTIYYCFLFLSYQFVYDSRQCFYSRKWILISIQ